MHEESLLTEKPVKQQVAGIGGSGKRRLAKVVGCDEDEAVKPQMEGSVQQPKKRIPKNPKRIKLSFDEDALETR